MPRILAAAVAALVLLVWMVAVAVQGVLQGLLGGSAPSPAAAADIPAAYLVLYRQAARDCPGLDWTVLAGIGKIESDHGRSPLPGVASGENYAGAGGPMQFLAPTFAAVTSRHRLPAGGAVPPSRYDPHDAIHAAAFYLCDHGAPTALAAAVFAYNHSSAYVAAVLAQADAYRHCPAASPPTRRHRLPLAPLEPAGCQVAGALDIVADQSVHRGVARHASRPRTGGDTAPAGA